MIDTVVSSSIVSLIVVVTLSCPTLTWSNPPPECPVILTWYSSSPSAIWSAKLFIVKGSEVNEPAGIVTWIVSLITSPSVVISEIVTSTVIVVNGACVTVSWYVATPPSITISIPLMLISVWVYILRLSSSVVLSFASSGLSGLWFGSLFSFGLRSCLSSSSLERYAVLWIPPVAVASNISSNAWKSSTTAPLANVLPSIDRASSNAAIISPLSNWSLLRASSIALSPASFVDTPKIVSWENGSNGSFLLINSAISCNTTFTLSPFASIK